MAFGIRLMPLDRQKQVLDSMRAELHPPKGVDAQLAGLPVLAADANAAVSSPWRRLAAAGARPAARSALVLLVAFRVVAPRADAAGADRAGDGLVGAGAVRDRGSR